MIFSDVCLCDGPTIQLYADSGGLFAITIYVARNRRPVCMISTAIITTVLRIKDRFIVIPNSGQGQEEV